MSDTNAVAPIYPGAFPPPDAETDGAPDYPTAPLNLTLGFDLETYQIPIDELMPSKKAADGVMTTRKFKQIVSSIREIGLIEPLSVIKPDPDAAGFLLLDGNLRVLALKELGHDEGVEVLDLGLCGTEEMYFATSHFGADGGICVTASHNPMDWNGMKMVRAESAPLDAATGLARIRALAEEDRFGPAKPGGSMQDVADHARAAYVAQVLSFVDVDALEPLRILVNAGNGAAGPTFDAIAAELAERGAPLAFERMHHRPDGQFPNGIPNPLLPENRPATADAVHEAGADFGVAWDGDFDRCFFFDDTGAFIDGEYVVGLLAEAFLAKDPGATIIHDPRIIWNTQDIVAKAGGRAVQTRTGHAFIKQAMRDENAVYGGEMSAHHYFRDFVYCDSGMIPWLLVAELVSRHGPLADLVAHRKAAFPSSGEINFTLDDPKAAIARVRAELETQATAIDDIDGLGFDLVDWRFNLRSSNTEPVVRLNVEARGDAGLVAEGVARVKALLGG